MDLCRIKGDADMYGLGIRLGFYLQWIAGIVADVLLLASCNSECRFKSLVTEVQNGRFSLQCFVGASFIAIIYQSARHSATVIDLYISLLVCFGCYFFFVPTFIWRVATYFDPSQDPTRWPSSPTSTTFDILDRLLVLASAAFQLWFWGQKVQQDTPNDCELFGFLFSKLSIGNLGLRITNIVVQTLILGIGLVASILQYRNRKGGNNCGSGSVSLQLRLLNTFISACVFCSTVAAVELTVSWNGLEGVYSVNSTGQLIPLIIGAVVLVRIFYKYFWPTQPEAEQQTRELSSSSPWSLPRFSKGAPQR